jgi:PITH domain
VYGLNLSVPEDAKAIIKPWDERDDTTKFVDSGVDDQVRLSLLFYPSGSYFVVNKLIIHIPFTQNVRIKSLILKLGEATLYFIVMWNLNGG